MFRTKIQAGFAASVTSSSSYSFVNQEHSFLLYRPKWPATFALAALQKADIHHDAAKGTWSGLQGRSAPVVVSIGSGAGADAEAFLQLGCIVYGIEPNSEFREMAVKTLGKKYPTRFFSIKGNAHELNLPPLFMTDLIVCAQALHTFRSDILRFPLSEALARFNWKAILPDDNIKRISIWYYNIDPSVSGLIDLDKRLRKCSDIYASSKTPLLDAPYFEPAQFQHYISVDEMTVSSAQPVDTSVFNLVSFKKWLSSYSFYPKTPEEEARILEEVSVWFALHKNERDEIEIRYTGFISQGPLRLTPYFECAKTSALPPPSPISLAARNTCAEKQPFWPSTPVKTFLQARL